MEIKTLSQLKKLLKACRESGLESFSIGQMSFRFRNDIALPKKIIASPKDAVPVSNEPMFSEMDTLFWSSPDVEG